MKQEIRDSKFFGLDSHLLGVEILEEGVWHLLGVSFIYIIKQRLHMRTNNSGFYIMRT
jgi:hypothetical protein